MNSASNLKARLLFVLVITFVGNSRLAAGNNQNAGRKLDEIPGFISIDCGNNEDYIDVDTNIPYISDKGLIDTGIVKTVSSDSPTDLPRYAKNLRSFPQGTRNCYTLKPEKGKNNNYLNRATFVYGNYDGENQIPLFDLHLGVNEWTTVNLTNASPYGYYFDIIHVPLTDYIDVCLANTGHGVPFISALELRHLDNSIYQTQGMALTKIRGYDVGRNSSDFSISESSENPYDLPDVVLKTAAKTQNSSIPLSLYWSPPDSLSKCYVYFHFAEIEKLEAGQQRELKINLNGERYLTESVKLDYLKPHTIVQNNPPISGERIHFSISAVEGNKLPPILNAKKDASNSEIRTPVAVETNLNTLIPDEHPSKCPKLQFEEIDRDPRSRKQICEFPINQQDEIRQAYLKESPYQPENIDYLYNDDTHRHRFQPSWFGSHKDWLEYSPSMDAIYCLPCYLFSKKPIGCPKSDVFISRGFNNWKKVKDGMNCPLIRHEGKEPNSPHKIAVKCCEDLKNHSRHIDKLIEKQTSKELENNRLRLKTSVECARWLAFQACAFRGHDESLDSKNREIGDAKFCILIDEARDESKKEQMAIILRLQLALVTASREVKDVHQFFDHLVNIINIVVASNKRNDELQHAQAEQVENMIASNEIETGRGANQIGTFQRAGDTRWGSHFQSISSLINMFDATCKVINTISEEGANYKQRGDAERAYQNLSKNEKYFFEINLTGEIATSFSNLKAMQSLDLSYNDLTGPLPEFLSEMPNLNTLNVSGNNLTGSVPEALLQKFRDGKLALSVGENPDLCLSVPCKRKKKKEVVVPIVASSIAAVLVLLFIFSALVIYRRKRKGDMVTKSNIKSKNQQYSYSEVVSITNNFRTIIGGGGFGKVYLGKLKDETQVAVKLLSTSSNQGYKEFRAEAQLLMIVHHKNLVSLVGYCDEGATKALIYEYMASGNLLQHLSVTNTNVLTWNERIHIAVDAAHGLEYLHNGCKPPIIHRDLKPSNILLNEHMQAKIADFGLSRAFATENDSHVSTRPAGTLGYVDPEFQSSGNFNKKNDVYSFGIILFELITGRTAIVRGPVRNNHILDWVNPLIERGDVQNIIDPRLEGEFNSTSAWKAIEIAMSCIPSYAIQRLDMSYVLAELKECLALEMAHEITQRMATKGNLTTSNTPFKMTQLEYESDIVPHSR
ncbi:putative leucine-rich repeat receptor-like serine/threonine-protein kinase At2g19230 [Quercus suber]|uniref:putative leucine-rich repeat receptor-like serine/threonine-protein kinase At2g19230 n=1 Tax=Quercus suber TaxID=58331 RepID=UPI0032DFFB42